MSSKFMITNTITVIKQPTMILGVFALYSNIKSET